MTSTTILLFSTLTVFTSSSEQNQKSVESNPETYRDEQITNTIAGDTVSKIPGQIRCIFQDSKNNFWFGTAGTNSFDGEGAFKYDGKSVIQFTAKHGLSNNQIQTIQEDKSGNIWFGTGKGVSRFDGRNFTTFPDKESLQLISSSNDEWKIEPDDLWFPAFTKGGVYRYSGNSFTYLHLPQTSPIKNDNNYGFFYDIYSTCKDKNGNVWFGTQGAGVCKYDGKKYTWFDNNELGGAVRSIFEDKNGTIWIGNNGKGLFRYDGKNLTNFTKEKKLENPDKDGSLSGKEGTLARVWTITEDKQGNLWVGTIDNGVWMFDGKTVTNYTTRDGLGIDFIWTIYKDKNGNLWFGTDGAGVYTFNGKTFIPFTGAKQSSKD